MLAPALLVLAAALPPCSTPSQCFEQGRVEAIERPGASADAWAKGCRAEHPSSCFELARLSMFGRGTTRDVKRSRELFRKACVLGEARACRRLVTASVNIPKAISIRACKDREAASCLLLANHAEQDGDLRTALRFRGEGCRARDDFACLEQGFMLLRREVEGASRSASFPLGRACRMGIGYACTELARTERDPERLARLQRRACEQARVRDAYACAHPGKAPPSGERPVEQRSEMRREDKPRRAASPTLKANSMTVDGLNLENLSCSGLSGGLGGLGGTLVIASLLSKEKRAMKKCRPKKNPTLSWTLAGKRNQDVRVTGVSRRASRCLERIVRRMPGAGVTGKCSVVLGLNGS